MSLAFYVWSNIPHPYVFLSFKTINFSTTCKAVTRHDGQRSYQNIPLDDSRSKKREVIQNDYDWKKTKLFLTLNLSGALIHYWFVVGEKTGSGPVILIMGLCSSLYYDWDEDVTMVWEQSSLFVLRTFLPNWVMCTTGFRTLTHQTPSVSVLLLGKKSQCFVSQFYNSWLTQEHSGWHGYVRKKTWPK